VLPFWFSSDRPPASSGEIRDAEAHLGQALPDELKALLRVQDGGVSNYGAFREGERHFPLLPFFCVGASRRGDTLMAAFDARADFGIPTNVVPFGGQGHSWWGLRYGEGDEPTVVFQLDEESPVEYVARTFREFLAGLVEE
jgi:hypothetical protein